MAVKTEKQLAVAGGIWKATSRQLDESMQIVGSGVGYGIAVVTNGTVGEVQVRDDGDQLGNGATTVANKFFGITVIQRTPLDENLEIDGYTQDTISAPVGQGQVEFVKEYDVLTVVRQGFVGVKTETTLAIGDAVYMRINVADGATTENGLVLGGITGTDDVNTELIPNAVVRVGASANDVAVIEIV